MHNANQEVQSVKKVDIKTGQLHDILRDAVLNVLQRDVGNRGPFMISDDKLKSVRSAVSA